MKKYLTLVEKELKKEAKKCKEVIGSYYNSNFIHLAAIKIPRQREMNKQLFSFPELNEKERFKLWTYIWNETKYFEVLNQPLMYLEKFKGTFDLEHWKAIKPWSKRIDNWAHGDVICSFYAELHEKFPKEVLPTLKVWNKSKNPWHRRLSIISLFYYSSARKIKQPSFNLALSMIKPLLKDEHFYVKKAFGWTLREMYNVYPEKTFKYLKSIAQDLPPAGWQAATEKLSKKDKALLKKLRS